MLAGVATFSLEEVQRDHGSLGVILEKMVVVLVELLPLRIPCEHCFQGVDFRLEFNNFFFLLRALSLDCFELLQLLLVLREFYSLWVHELVT